MAKSELTRKLENELIKEISGKGMNKSYGGNEVAINHKAWSHTKNVDVLEYDRVNDEFVCYEIKISKSDFKSENGHNFVGNRNYYVVPENLVEFAKDFIKRYPENKVGVMSYHQNSSSYGWFKIDKHCKKTQYEMDFGLRAILMYNLMRSLHRDIKKYKELDQIGQINTTYYHKNNKGRKEFRAFYKGEYLTRQEIYEIESEGKK